ncbi:dTDP-4-dehydrorhamnose reductase [Hippea alviniae]|uniref:dTDP-4-dehydrorhamnose reductase n=1 Tax=Hippea alviniae TaxID=1279027 RepID=UPI0003B66805|nr:dTDP-4-dehydrorhamnose reductase [Hippea alviniae]
MNEARILVTGSSGQLGGELHRLIMNHEIGVINGEKSNSTLKTQNSKFYFTDIDELDITKEDKIKEFIDKSNVNVIINCAAYTAVDKAEEEKELADLINHKAVEYLAKVSKEYGIFLIHISTDYVFDGKNYRPYTEDDKTNPQSVYGLTKLKGEEALINSEAKGVIIRTSWLCSSFGHNFVKTMLKLAQTRKELNVVYDQVGTPTYARDLASALLTIMNYELGIMNEKDGNVIQNSTPNLHNSVRVYHYSNEGVCSWYDFAKAIFEIKGIDIRVNPIETKDYPTPAKRPHYSVLNKAKIKRDFGIEIPYWRDSLKRMLSETKGDSNE